MLRKFILSSKHLSTGIKKTLIKPIKPIIPIKETAKPYEIAESEEIDIQKSEESKDTFEILQSNENDKEKNI